MKENPQAPGDRVVGLCGACEHGRLIVSSRGSRFWRCERSLLDPSFPRYPPLPVITCVGYEPTAETAY